MKKDFVKKVVVLALSAGILIANTAYASTSNQGCNVKMNNVYVEGNKYNSVVKGYKTESNKSLKIEVTRMLKDDKNSSNYQYSWWQIINLTDGVALNNGTKATLDKACKITLNRKTSKSKKLSITAKGNKASLDTIINGYIYDFNKK